MHKKRCTGFAGHTELVSPGEDQYLKGRVIGTGYWPICSIGRILLSLVSGEVTIRDQLDVVLSQCLPGELGSEDSEFFHA